MRVARTKNGYPPKECAACGRPFEWRKKWERDWDQVVYCSEACKKLAKQQRAKKP